MTNVDNTISQQTKAYLSMCGLSAKSISKFTRDTRLWHDLGIYGDIAEGNLECLHDHFGVDLTEFDFEKYFPVEFIGNSVVTSILIRMVPFLGDYFRRRVELTPLTLGMIEDAITNKRLV